MKIFQELFPPRFRTYEDAVEFQECFRSGKEFPRSKWIYPLYVSMNGDAVVTQEYNDAPYQSVLVKL